VVSYGGKTIQRWRTAAILKIDISPHLSEKSSDFHDVIKKMKKLYWSDSEFDSSMVELAAAGVHPVGMISSHSSV